MGGPIGGTSRRSSTRAPMRTSLESLGPQVVEAEAAAAAAMQAPAGEASAVSRHPLLRAIDLCAGILVVAALLAELGLVLANVLARAWFHRSFLWSDEAARLPIAAVTMLSSAS